MFVTIFMIMAAAGDKKKNVEEVGVLPLPDSKSSRNWWLAFGACCLMTFGTRLYKVNLHWLHQFS